MLLGEQCFQAVVEAQDIPPAVIVDELHLPQAAVHIVTHFVVGLAGCDVNQILAQSSDTVVDSHIVVVEDNQQVVGVGRGIVQPFEGQSSGHCPVADHGYYVAVVFLLQLRGDRHTHGCRNGVGGMSGNESVILTFSRVGETADSFEFPERMKSLPTSGQDFVPVSLMSDVPNDPVVGRIEDIMQGDGQFDSTEAGSQMAGVFRKYIYYVLPQLFTYLAQFLLRQLA